MDYAKQFEINKKYLMKNCGMEDFCFGLGSDFDIRVAEDECAFHVVIDENSQFYFLKYANNETFHLYLPTCLYCIGGRMQ